MLLGAAMKAVGRQKIHAAGTRISSYLNSARAEPPLPPRKHASHGLCSRHRPQRPEVNCGRGGECSRVSAELARVRPSRRARAVVDAR